MAIHPFVYASDTATEDENLEEREIKRRPGRSGEEEGGVAPILLTTALILVKNVGPPIFSKVIIPVSTDKWDANVQADHERYKEPETPIHAIHLSHGPEAIQSERGEV